MTAAFTPPVERLAFPFLHAAEADLPGIFPSPLPVVIDVLTRYATVAQVHANLPDCNPADPESRTGSVGK